MVSYEISIGLILISIVLYTGSLNLLDIVLKQGNMHIGFILPFFPLFILFFISSLAETNRPPFDLPEAILLWSLKISLYAEKSYF
jgi:NADH-quinone oxidoreductase subunit H